MSDEVGLPPLGSSQADDELIGRDSEIIDPKYVGGLTGITRQRLLDLFNVVVDPEDWKNPIDAVIDLDPADEQTLIQAVIFFTGSVPEIERHPFGGGDIETRVIADGYYRTIGA